METKRVYDIDAIEGMKHLDSESVDLILCDLPYGATANGWDTPIDMDELWEQYRRIIKPRGAIVLFGSGAFTAELITAGRSMYRYSLVWEKPNATGFLNAKLMPLRAHEDLAVFYKKPPTYNPQMSTGHKPVNRYTKTNDGTNYQKTRTISGGGNTDRYPRSVLRFGSDKQKSSIHPTQKPIALLRWIIRTYTNPGDVVLDNACGSGSTLVAADLEGRDWIGFDNGICKSKHKQLDGRKWADIAAERVKKEGGTT